MLRPVIETTLMIVHLNPASQQDVVASTILTLGQTQESMTQPWSDHAVAGSTPRRTWRTRNWQPTSGRAACGSSRRILAWRASPWARPATIQTGTGPPGA